MNQIKDNKKHNDRKKRLRQTTFANHILDKTSRHYASIHYHNCYL